MGFYTEAAIELANMKLDQAFIKEEYTDNEVDKKVFEYECMAEDGITYSERESQMCPEEMQAYDEAVDQIPVDKNIQHEAVLRILQCKDSTISLDEAMGIDSPWDDSAIVEELRSLDD